MDGATELRQGGSSYINGGAHTVAPHATFLGSEEPPEFVAKPSNEVRIKNCLFNLLFKLNVICWLCNTEMV